MAELIKQIMANIMPHVAMRTSVPEFPSGLARLDDILFGFKRSETYVIAGRPSQGKSALSVFIAWHLSYYLNKRIGLFSLEMSKEQIAERCLAMATETDNELIQRGGLGEDGIKKLTDFIDQPGEPLFAVCDDQGFQWEDIENFIKSDKPDMVIVDYVQMISAKKGMQEREVYGEYVRKTKKMAKQYDIPIIINSQINRAGEGTSPTEIPKMSALKGSGTLEENVDGVIIVHWNWRLGAKKENAEGIKVDYPKDEYQIYVAKNRNGRTGVATVSFIPEWYKFKSYQ